MRLFHSIRILLLLIIASSLFISCSATNPLLIDNADRLSLEEIQIHFIDVGDGDATLIRLPGNKNILIDAGGTAEGPGLVRYLRSVGVRHIDHLIFTHPHDDHIGGLFSLLPVIEVKNFYDNGSENLSSIMYEDYLMSVRNDLSRYRVLQAGESLLFGGVKIDVVNPLLPLTGNLNEDSIVLRMRYGGITILLAGDIGETGERRLLDIGTELKSHVLKVGHHGDFNASSEEFLSAVRPQAAIISVGTDDKYSRPKLETLIRLKKAGAKVYRTDRNGHIILKTNGKVFPLITSKPLNGERK